MKLRRAYKFRLKANASQSERLSQFAGCNRLVWNKALALQKTRLDQQLRVLSYEDTAKELVVWKEELPFLGEVHSQPLQQTLMDQSKALKESFQKRKGFPRFKKKGQHDSFRFPQGVKITDNKIYLPKLGWFGIFKSREIAGNVKNVTVSRTCGKWYVSIQVETEAPDLVHPSSSTVGIDMGVVNFATLSDGTVIKPINSFKILEKKLARAKRVLSKRESGSANWKKQKIRVQKIYSKIACVRKDFLHKVTSGIVKNHGVVVLEDLKVSNMSKSARGTVDKPGKNVAAKAGLNKSILDQGWYEFRRQITYKQEWSGGRVILISPVNTSRMCSSCGHVASENRTDQANFHCVNCGHKEKADLNAARNIQTAGRAGLACGDIRQIAV